MYWIHISKKKEYYINVINIIFPISHPLIRGWDIGKVGKLVIHDSNHNAVYDN